MAFFSFYKGIVNSVCYFYTAKPVPFPKNRVESTHIVNINALI